MTSHALVTRVGSALAMLVATEALVRYARARALGPEAVARLAWGVWWATRPLLALVVFLILKVPLHSDAEQHYWPQAQAALAGGLVYRDFASSYGPLFPYLAAGVIALGTSPLAFVAAAIGCEALALKLWLRSSEAPHAEGALAYACTRCAPRSINGRWSIFVAVELALLAAYAGLLRAAWLGLVPSKTP